MTTPTSTKPNPQELLSKADALLSKQRAGKPISTIDHADIKAELLAAAEDADGLTADHLLTKAELVQAMANDHAAKQSRAIRRGATSDLDFTGRTQREPLSSWRTANGQRVIHAGKGEKLFDAYREAGAVESADDAELSIGRAIQAMVTGDWSGAGPEKAALSTGSQSGGGFLLEPALSSKVIDLARSASVVFQAGAQVFDMPTSEVSMVRVTTDPTASWTTENAQLSTTQPVFGRLRFRARKLGAIVPISKELVADAPNAAQEIERLLQTVMAQELDRVILLGDADGEEPLGIFNHGDVSENAIGGAVDWDDFMDSVQVVEDANGMPNAILYPPAVKKALAQLKVNSEANHYAAPPTAITDLQRLTTTKLANSQAVVGDFENVMVGIRSGVEIVATDKVNISDGQGFERDQVLIKVRWRGDVQLAHGDHFEKLTGIS